MEFTRWARYVVAVAVCGALAGLVGAATSELLHALQHLTYGYHSGSLLLGVTRADWRRRVAGPVVGGLLAGLCWWWLRRRHTVDELTPALREGRRLRPVAQTADALVQVLLVGSGASLGRESAPRQIAASAAALVLGPFAVAGIHRRILVSSAAGAGLAAVYNVPVAGALFTISVILQTWDALTVATALATSAIAVAVTVPITHDATTFSFPPTHAGWGSALFALVCAPVGAVLGLGFSALMHRSSARTAASWHLVPALAVAGLITGVAAVWLPELPGNGKSIVATAFSPGATLAVLGAAVIVKPLLTGMYLRAGAVGGLLTPAFATGAAAGAFISLAIHQMGGHTSTPAFTVIGAATVLAVTQRAPLFAAVFAYELTDPPLLVAPLLVISAVGAHLIADRLRHRHSLRAAGEHPDKSPGR